MKNLFVFGNEISKRTLGIISILGMLFLMFIWWYITAYEIVSSYILPNPIKVLKSYPDLVVKNHLISNLWFSIKINLYGYLEAVIISIPFGFIIGTIPFFRGLLSKYVDAIRFIPLTAVTGLFIAWFGSEIGMKVHFLAFGIIIYLLPIIVVRIDEIEKIYIQTAWTLGANWYKRLIHVYLPSVLSRVFNDIKIMVAISWTYIIAIELVNNEGGIGAMIFTMAKQARTDKVFAILFVIIAIGFLQDKLFKYLDRVLFPYKHEDKQIKRRGFLHKLMFKQST